MAQLANHLHVVRHTLMQALGLERLADTHEIIFLLLQVVLNLINGLQLAFLTGQEKVGGINLVGIISGNGLSAHGIDLLDGFDVITPETDTDDALGISQEYVDRITLYAEIAQRRGHIVARIKAGHEFAQQDAAVKLLPHPEFDNIFVECSRIAHTVDTRHRRHDQHVLAPREQRRGGSQPQAVDFLIDGKVLFNIGIGGSQIGFGLIIIVIGHVVFHRVVGKKLLELTVKLRSQCFVVAQHQGGLVDLCNDVGYRKGLARPGNAQQRLVGNSLKHALGELTYGLRLVARRLIVGN